MSQAIEEINKILQELVDRKVQDTLLNVQILAFKIKNDKLKLWVESELNGYKDIEIPSYSKIATAVFGNLVNYKMPGRLLVENNKLLTIEYLE